MNKLFLLLIFLVAAKAEAQNETDIKNAAIIMASDATAVIGHNILPGTPFIETDRAGVLFTNHQQTQNFVLPASFRIDNKTQNEGIDLTRYFINSNSESIKFSSVNKIQNQINWQKVSTNALLNDSIVFNELQKANDAVLLTNPKKELLNNLESVADTSAALATLVLYTASKSFPQNNAGAFIIQNAEQNQFSFAVNGTTASLGWNDSARMPLAVNASSININGVINANLGLIVTDGSVSSNITLPAGIEAYFSSNSNSPSGIVIENKNMGLDASSSIFLKRGDVINSISTLAINGNATNDLKDAFVFQTNSANGICFNTTSSNSNIAGPIRFTFNSTDVFTLDNIYNSVLIGTMTPESSLILTVRSSKQGVSFCPMTSEQRRNIRYPVESMTVYDTDLHKYCFYNGSKWEKLLSEEIE